MEKVVWSEELSVGVALFDRQHKRLVAMLNEIIEHPTAPVRSETVVDILTGMTRYALTHFKSEEDLMRKYGYPQLEEHKRQHQAFWQKVTELNMATTAGENTVPEALLAFLRQWLTRHIMQEDMEYKAFFQEKGLE